MGDRTTEDSTSEDIIDSTSGQTKFEWGTASKMIEWTLLLFVILLITSRIIKGIPPSDEVPGVKSQKPNAIWIFALISYIIMVLVKVIANRNIILRTSTEKKRVQGWWQVLNILIYFVIIVLAYTFCTAYLCMKVRRKPINIGQFGGMFDWMNKGESNTNIDPAIQMIIIIGVLLVILNAFTNLFLYLKSKETKRDSVARSIYQAQLTVLLLMILTIIFLIALSTGKKFPPWNEVDGWDALNTTRGEVFKTSIYIVLLALGTTLVNVGASSGFFGLTNPGPGRAEDH
tara:strand:+ start:1272 stop:2132 length:861 start_codon:yes stop_codon:yes gene_type:complete